MLYTIKEIKSQIDEGNGATTTEFQMACSLTAIAMMMYNDRVSPK